MGGEGGGRRGKKTRGIREGEKKDRGIEGRREEDGGIA